MRTRFIYARGDALRRFALDDLHVFVCYANIWCWFSAAIPAHGCRGRLGLEMVWNGACPTSTLSKNARAATTLYGGTFSRPPRLRGTFCGDDVAAWTTSAATRVPYAARRVLKASPYAPPSSGRARGATQAERHCSRALAARTTQHVPVASRTRS